MTGTRDLRFVISADYARRTGGWIYDRRLLQELRGRGWRIEEAILPAGFPQPSATARARSAALFRAIPDGRIVLVDQLCLGVLPEVARAEGRRLRLVMTLGGRRFLLTLAIVGASVCLALGVSLPIIKLTKFVFFTYEHSLISTVNALIRSGQIFLGITVLIFSIALPILKLLYLLLLSTLPKRELQRLSRQLRALEWIGKWSMHDVLVLSLSIFFIKSQGVYDARSLNGVYFFTAAVLFMLGRFSGEEKKPVVSSSRSRCSKKPINSSRPAGWEPRRRRPASTGCS